MMLIKIEIHPGGRASVAREIRRIKIANVSEPHDAEVAGYECSAFDESRVLVASATFAHRREDGPLVCAEKAIAALGRKGAR